MGLKSIKRRSPLRELELLDLVHDAINAADANGIFHTWNAAAERLYGYSAEEALGQHFSLLLFPQDISTLTREVIEPLSNSDVQDVVVRNRRKDGTEIFVALRLSVLRDAQGNIEHIIGCSNDITERKRAEDALKREIEDRKKIQEALQSSEQRLRHLLLFGPAVLYTCRPYGDFGATFVSPNAQSLFGYDPADFVREPNFWVDRIHPDDRDRVWAEITKKTSTGRTSVEYRFRHADGGYRWVRDTTAIVYDEDGKAVEMIGHMTDVTLEKESEAVRREHERLQYFSEALLSAQEAERKRVSRELHDDLNQRLGALILEMGAVERHLPDSASHARKAWTSLKAHVKDISDEVRRIALQLHSAGLEHFGLAATLRQECTSLAGRTGLLITFRARAVPDEIPQNVSLCLYRVAQECLRNVLKHAKAKRVSVTLSGKSSRIQLCVKDDGIGFDPEEARTRMTLGLISMNERLRQVNGSLKLNSSPGRGTRIECVVPLRLEDGT